MNQHNAEGRRLEFAAGYNSNIVTLTYVVDMDWDASISANAMFLHQCNKFTLCEVVWGAGLSLHKFHLF